MTDYDDLIQQDFLETLVKHYHTIQRNSLISAALYAVFVTMSILVAIDRRPWQDPLTLLCIGVFIAAMIMLPRDYVPPLYARKSDTQESEAILNKCRHLQRVGLTQRIVYFVVAALTMGLVPWLLSRYGA